MISLRSGAVTVTVDAVNGGRLAALEVAGHATAHQRTSPNTDRCTGVSFPMVPWAGRVRRGRFTFGGRVHDLPLDMPPHAIHGTAYRRPWHVEAVGDDAMSMSCDLAWELGGRAWQRITAGDTSVSCVLGVVAGDRAMPAEIGWHPWFTKPLAMTFRPEAMYARDGEGIPTGELVPPPPGPWDDCFVNTDTVELHYAELTVTVSSDCDHWVVYDEPPHATCVEPQSGPPDAFNLHPCVLEPGEQLVRTMVIGCTID